jgi:NAD(P)-dependent dehydrogenase (short-subunit alcohol dehydrogenase family)
MKSLLHGVQKRLNYCSIKKLFCLITTNLLAPAGLDDTTLQNFASATLNKIPLKRFGKAEEVAKFLAFLSGDDAAFITGSEYVIDGGTNVNAIIG